MKKLLFITAISLLFFSCEETFQLDPNAMISIKPAAGAWNAPQKVKSNDSTHLSAVDIVKQTNKLSFYNIGQFGNQAVDRGFSQAQRDTISEIPSLKMFGTDIINQKGEYHPNFIEGTDCVLVRIINLDMPNQIIDTVAYIPNSVIRTAETQIKAAYAALDNEEVYRIFNEAFTFIPITGAEWRTLKANNEN